jgi:hypothetical protein
VWQTHLENTDSGAAERGIDVAEQILDHEPACAGAGINRREDEQRLEQDGEVVPEGFEGLASEACAMICAMPTAKVGAPPARLRIVCSPTSLRFG